MTQPTTDPSGALQAALGDQYRLEREIGRGGMGVVYLATDVALERTVAVKVISPELALNRTLADRFISEARLIARLRHPNIVSVYTAGTAQGLLYYVMDYVPGESLRDLLQQEGRLHPELAAQITADIAAALDAAAEGGVVHRDIKPENILVERTGSRVRALLADFGIAYAVAAEGNLTGPGVAMGTPAYMSPEQAAGEAVDARSDLYALGVVAYEMLAGRPPFEGPRRTVISQQIVDPPPPLARQCPAAPASLVAAVERALEKVPEARWQTGQEFRRALFAGEPGTPPRGQPVRRTSRLAAVAALVLLVATLSWAALRPEGPPSGVNPRHSFLVLPFGNLRDDATMAWLANGSVSMLDLALSQWRELRVVGQEQVHDLLSRESLSAGDGIGLDQARRLARENGAWTVVLGEFERTRDSLHLVARAYDVRSGARLEVAEAWGHLGDDVRPLFDELAAKLLDLSGAPETDRAALASVTSSSLEAYRAYLRGMERLQTWNLGQAEGFFEEAVTIDSTFGLAFFRLAQTRGWMTTAQDTLTERYLASAARYSSRLPVREQTMISAYRSMIGQDYPRARELYGELLARDSADADAWYGLGDALFHDMAAGNADHAGTMTSSLRAFQRSLALDPHFGLAYEHVNAMLTSAAMATPSMALMPGDRFVDVYSPSGSRTLTGPALEAAIARAREAAIAGAREWTSYQPGTIRAHRALMEAYLAAGRTEEALGEVAAMAELWSEPAKPLAGFLEARIRLMSGDAASAARGLRGAVDRFDPAALPLSDYGQEVIADVLSGANTFAYVGDVGYAEVVIGMADQLRRQILPEGAIVDAYGDERVWQSARLAALHSAVGTPAYELRELWRRVSRVAGGAEQRRRPILAWAGASAAQGLLAGPAADPSALVELETLTGVPARSEFRALAAAVRGDTGGARQALAEKTDHGTPGEMKPGSEPVLRQAAAFAMGDPRPVAAEVQFLLGNYSETIALLESFQPDRLGTRSFDSRWGLLARVRLLRGLAFEKLGRGLEAEGEFNGILAQWDGADQRLQLVVAEARAGLSRIRSTAKG